ncbi:hypothetical protein THUN1379_24630 [Paludibacterium sp. THUN1379]|nr:hypothetical protein THUN1379_24630 [Paludibacterium sp. THUN1379]
MGQYPADRTNQLAAQLREDRKTHLYALLKGYPEGRTARELTAQVRDCAAFCALSENSCLRTVQALLQQMSDPDEQDDGILNLAITNPGQKPLRYAWRSDPDKPYFAKIWRQEAGPLIRQRLPHVNTQDDLQALIRDLTSLDGQLALNENRVAITPSDLRLTPPKIDGDVLYKVLQAVAERCKIQITYKSSTAKPSTPILSPLAVLQRGPIVYLITHYDREENHKAKGSRPDDTHVVYALHRMSNVQLLQAPARVIKPFSFERALQTGELDFAKAPTPIKLVFLAQTGSQAHTLLDASRLNQTHVVDECIEKKDGKNYYRHSAEVLQTNTLIAGLLSFGPQIEVLEPASLRQIMAEKVAEMSAMYGVENKQKAATKPQKGRSRPDEAG